MGCVGRCSTVEGRRNVRNAKESCGDSNRPQANDMVSYLKKNPKNNFEIHNTIIHIDCIQLTILCI